MTGIYDSLLYGQVGLKPRDINVFICHALKGVAIKAIPMLALAQYRRKNLKLPGESG